jgi:rod shape-determining protein MreC
LTAVLSQLETRQDLFSSAQERDFLLKALSGIQGKMKMTWEDDYLAKGELHGSSAPFWRSRKPILKGIGFNFDYSDEEGLSRDLKTGRLIGSSTGGVPILREGDLLVTSGLDGVFPPGLRVGIVSKLKPLKQGSYAYELEARPVAAHLNDLQTLFILPSLSAEE